MRFYLNDLEEGTENKSCLTESVRGALKPLRLYLQQNLEEWLQPQPVMEQ